MEKIVNYVVSIRYILLTPLAGALGNIKKKAPENNITNYKSTTHIMNRYYLVG